MIRNHRWRAQGTPKKFYTWPVHSFLPFLPQGTDLELPSGQWPSSATQTTDTNWSSIQHLCPQNVRTCHSCIVSFKEKSNKPVQGDFALQDCNHDRSQDKQSHVYINRFSDSRVLPEVSLRSATQQSPTFISYGTNDGDECCTCRSKRTKIMPFFFYCILCCLTGKTNI